MDTRTPELEDRSDTSARVEELERKLEASVKELEAFLYSISHDLRAPLRSMVASSMILQEDFAEVLPPDAKYELDRISRNAAKISTIIDDILQMSRLNRHQMTCRSVDLSSVASSIASELTKGEAEHVRITVQPDIRVDGDPHLLKTAMEHLLGNAVKFSRKNPDAQASFTREEIDGETVLVVRDNGVGFEMGHVEKAFQPFERLHADTDFPGTGIGLTKVQRIVERHRGRIWAEASPNEGAAFFFTTNLRCPQA